MKSVVGIVNYGMAGNIHSIKKALKKAGAEVIIVNEKSDFEKVSKIVIPGVGTFRNGMEELISNGLLDVLKEQIKSKPTLGICLGMQLLSSLGYEDGKTKGLGVINAEVKAVEVDDKVPHMGYNKIEVLKDNDLLKGIENEEFYFMHSFEVVNYTNILSLTNYSGHSFVSAVQKENIYGVQFHPEKSRNAGIKLFENFIEL